MVIQWQQMWSIHFCLYLPFSVGLWKKQMMKWPGLVLTGSKGALIWSILEVLLVKWIQQFMEAGITICKCHKYREKRNHYGDQDKAHQCFSPFSQWKAITCWQQVVFVMCMCFIFNTREILRRRIIGRKYWISGLYSCSSVSKGYWF